MDPMEKFIDILVPLLDKAFAKIVELERRLEAHDKKLDEVFHGHQDSTRDKLKERLDALEKKLHAHFEQTTK